jgi:curved DNA-binding protein
VGRGPAAGTSGDLYLTVKIAPHPRFKRQGAHLYCDLPVDLYTAALGGKAELQTLSGKIKVDIPAGTQNGKVLRLRGQGMPIYKKSGRGDMYAKVMIHLPANLSAKETELFKQLQELRNGR